MSATATTIDIRQFLADRIEQTAQTYIKDLKHIPAEKLGQTPMGCARTPLEFTAECIGFNKLLAKTVRGEEAAFPDEEQRKAFYASINSYDVAKSALESATADLVAAVRSMKEEDLTREVMTYWGSPIQLAHFIYIAASHLAYHDGQLNYIQCLYGDGAFHWMEE